MTQELVCRLALNHNYTNQETHHEARIVAAARNAGFRSYRALRYTRLLSSAKVQ